MCGGPPKMAPTKAAIDAMSQTELFAEFAAANLDMEDLVWLPALKSRLRAHYYGDNGPPTPPTPDSPASLRAASPTPPREEVEAAHADEAAVDVSAVGVSASASPEAVKGVQVEVRLDVKRNEFRVEAKGIATSGGSRST